MDAKRELVDLLLEDAREDTETMARQLGRSQDEVEEMLDELESNGSIAGYQAVVDWSKVDEDHVTAEVELNLELDRDTTYAQVAQRIAKFDEVTALHLVSGDYDFDVTVEAESMRAVSMFVSEQIAPIPEVTQTVTHFVMKTYKNRGIEFTERDDDDRLSVSP
ncbi:Lrp/AsnC family transcriptional regulator [Haloplanus aerogenes]|uniref:DNA-binding Lrp family transcriptional regulator n=1 Tax=Haloplanus aerogenes TaxID=660522 RepID=A0A3M0DDR6_9EURY|nr:Lrp/AsnC family transcriptional regulator [Haloplanus aerogenes]AZH26137.1 Lrp/AsnC family transcriptional regulator [Haloplanus aerogenes]RMB18410.1 DNA-binding Lrp family transcriptional regulator [Haloplanus aerogenes]